MRYFRVIGVIVLALLAIGLAGAIYQTGYQVGAEATGATAPVVVAPGYGYGWHGWGWGFGGGLFGFLGFLLFLFIFIGILRALFGGWGRRGGWGPGYRGGWGRGDWGQGGHKDFGPWEDRAREVHDEWHRRQDAGTADSTNRPSGAGPNDTSSGGAA
jgi:hypothetical protein